MGDIITALQNTPVPTILVAGGVLFLFIIMIAIDEDADFLLLIWEADDPSSRIRYRESLGGESAGLDWRFEIQAQFGTLLIDDFAGISFSSFTK